MARIPRGIPGEFIGTAVNVSGYLRYGDNFLRSRRRKSGNVMMINGCLVSGKQWRGIVANERRALQKVG